MFNISNNLINENKLEFTRRNQISVFKSPIETKDFILFESVFINDTENKEECLFHFAEGYHLAKYNSKFPSIIEIEEIENNFFTIKINK